MKKLSAFLIGMLVFLSITSYAFQFGSETTEVEAKFNLTALEKNPYYKYDKFTKSWNIQGDYTAEYRDCRASVRLLLFRNYVDNQWGPELRVEYFNKELKEYMPVSAFRAVVGDKVYKFEKLSISESDSYAFSCITLQEFCNAMINANAKEIAFQISFTEKGSGWVLTMDSLTEKDLVRLKSVASALKKSNAWTIQPYNEEYDSFYQASIE